MRHRNHPDHRRRWLGWCCLATFLAGVLLGWRTIGDDRLLPLGKTVIPPSTYHQLALANPFPARPTPTETPGSLRIWLYRMADMGDPPLAETVHPVAFDLDTPWVRALLQEKNPTVENSFTLKMRGQIRFAAPLTQMHLKSDNGYRVRLRGREGKEAMVENWANDVTTDFLFFVTAEPGWYEIEIDYNNVQGGAFFDLWSDASDIAFMPADPASSPAGSGR